MEDYQWQAHEAAGEYDERAAAWLQAVRRGFGQERTSEENLRRWWDTAVRDHQRWRSATRQARSDQLAWEGWPVATFGSLEHRITVGRGNGWGPARTLPALFVTDVTVRSTDRRRGLLRAMMTAELTEARERGLPLAALTATEGGIYGRFGFGVSLQRRGIELACTERFQLRREPSCQVEEVDPSGSGDLLTGLMDEFAAQHRGAHQRLAMHREYLSGTWDWEKGAPATAIRVAVALGDLGPCGAVVVDGSGSGDQVKVLAMIADGDAELALWQWVARLDLVAKATFGLFQDGSPLMAALVDPRVVRTTSAGDWTWLRILDVPAALAGRDWEHSGTVTLEVDDPMGLADGCWRLVVADGAAEVETADPSQAEVRLDVAALAETYLGATPLSVLARAGRVVGDPLAVERFGWMLAVAEPPRNLVGF